MTKNQILAQTATKTENGRSTIDTATIDADLHRPSVESLVGTGPASLYEALTWIFPCRSESLGDIELVGVDFAPDAHWHAKASQPTWVRPLRITVSALDTILYFELQAVPWLCDERAANTTVHDGDQSVGGHRGLFIGRPLMPRLQLVPRPGLRQRATRTGVTHVLVPDIGSAVSFASRKRSLLVRFGKRKVSLDHGLLEDLLGEDPATGDRTELSGRDRSRVLALGLDGGSQSRRFSPEALLSVDKTLGLIEPTWQERAVRLAAYAAEHSAMDAEYLVDELSEEALQYRPYGDLLRRTIARGVLRGFRRYTEIEGELAARLDGSTDEQRTELLRRAALCVRQGAQREISATVRPGATGGVVGPADDRGTVAAVEAARIVTRYGPGGERRLGPYRLWLRGEHPSRRGEICPILTPESEDIGLIRSAAVGAIAADRGIEKAAAADHDLADLSVAAALIPFVNHDDPTRASIAARMLRQAVPIKGARRPMIETAAADLLASEHGTRRAGLAGTISATGRNWIEITPASGEPQTISFGPSTSPSSNVDGSWHVHVSIGDEVYSDDVVATAPDIALAGDQPHLAQGRDCLVAYTPWKGWNFEDAIVVSAAIVDAFSSSHFVRTTDRLDLLSGEIPHVCSPIGSEVTAGDVVVDIARDGAVRRRILADANGVVTSLSIAGGEVAVELRVERPLAVGDKLTNRHGAKGVVSAILPQEQMPTLPDGRPIEVLLNPLGVIRRLNLSQLFETHTTLLADLSGSTATQIVGRRMSSPAQLARALTAQGADGGRLPIRNSDGSQLGGEAGVVVGWQHMLKLDHLAVNKLRSRAMGTKSPLNRQPAKGSNWVAGQLVGGAQRLGEMELWALQAVSADQLVQDAHERSDGGRDSMEAVAAHLRAGGLRLIRTSDHQIRIESDPDAEGLTDVPLSIIEAITQPRLATGEPSPTYHALHDHHHGLNDGAISCPCGQSTQPGEVCGTCGCETHRQPGRDRRDFRFRIPLATPIPHPWKPNDEGWNLRSIPILPPGYRPFMQNHLDAAYGRLIIENARVLDNPRLGSRRLQLAVNDLLGSVSDDPSALSVAARINGKQGLLRRSLRGRNTDFAARGVMVPDPSRDVETIGVPRSVADRLGLLGLSSADEVVLINRQPTLLPTNLVALRFEVIHGSAFQLHPFLCARLAGDFDGDEITVHRVLGSAAKVEAWELLRPSASFRHIANHTPMSKSDLDVALGLWLLGQNETGRANLSTRLALEPDDEINAAIGPITTYEKDALVRRLAERHQEGRLALDSMIALFEEGVNAATGWSFSALELLGLLGDRGDDDTLGWIPQESPLGQAIAAGVAGKPKGILQMLCNRGSLEGFDGLMTPRAEQSFLHGLHNNEFFDTAPGGLRALSDKKLVTPIAGGLTKSLIEGAYDICISEEDCGSVRHGFGSILTCAATGGPCSRCYSAAGGFVSAVGSRIGLLAAFAVGERSTQNAMKAFQGGTTLAVGGNVRRLRALFGDGRIRFAEGTRAPQTLADVLSEASTSVESFRAAYDALLDEANDCLDEQVSPHHLELLWRSLDQTRAGGSANLLTGMQWPGSAFIHATSRGDLQTLVSAANQPADKDWRPSRLRLAVIERSRQR